MTKTQAWRLYKTVFPDGTACLVPDDVHEDMEEVVSASSERKAVNVIRWWDCWNFRTDGHTVTKDVREIRRLAKLWGYK